jgi:hypothetical protein
MATTSFGADGTRDETTCDPSVTVDATAGEYLDYNLKASGAVPGFTYVCAHRDPISNSKQFPGHPQANYRWKLQRTGAALPTVVAADSPTFDAYTVTLLFIAALEYELTINLCNQDGTLKKLVQNISYKSANGGDNYSEPLGVSWT